jgi:hypothetical protein
MSIFRVSASPLALLLPLIYAAPAGAQTPIAPGERLAFQKATELTLRNHPRGPAARSEAASISERIGGKDGFVFVVQDDSLIKKPVSLGITDGRSTADSGTTSPEIASDR